MLHTLWKKGGGVAGGEALGYGNVRAFLIWFWARPDANTERQRNTPPERHEELARNENGVPILVLLETQIRQRVPEPPQAPR